MNLKQGKWLISLFTAVILVICFGNKAWAEEITLTKDSIRAEITRDGSMLVTEDLTFDISGKYNGVFKDISYDKAEGISGITAAEIKGNLMPYEEVNSARNGDAGVFTLEKESKNVRVKIYSPSKNEIKTFRITYKITGAVKKYNDIGELYWKFIGRENETFIENLEIFVTLPVGSSKEEMKVFGHGPRDGNWNILDDRTVKFAANEISPGTYVEVRTIFPKELLSVMNTTIKENKFDSIMAEENRYIEDKVKRAEERKRFVEATRWITVPMGILSVLLIVYILTSKKKHDADDLLAMRDIRNYNPAVLAYNANGFSSDKELLATIFDLVRRNYLSIETIELVDGKVYKINKLKEKDEGLLQHEAYLIHWLLGKIGDGNFVTLKQIRKHGKNNPGEFTRQFDGWKREVAIQAEKNNLFDRRAKQAKAGIIILELIMIIAAVVFMFMGNMYGAVSFVLSLAAIIATALMNTRTLEGNIQYALWNKMAARIKKLSKTEIDRWAKEPSLGEMYLIYAIAMGQREDLLDKITPNISSEDYYTNSNFWMLYYLTSHNYSSINHTFDFSSSKSEYSGSFSSGSSGGFDSGGGGGAGGF
jgi:uncharacterized membrane protein